MPWSPVTGLPIQYSEDASGTAASGHYLKFYASGTTTPINMATDSTGGTTLAKCQLNSLGYPINGSSAVFIPHVQEKYKAALFPTEADADANNFNAAIWAPDGTNPPGVDALVSVRASGEFIKYFATVAAAQAATTLVSGDTISITARDNALFVVSGSGSANGYSVISLANSLYATLETDGINVRLKHLGAALDGTTRDTLVARHALEGWDTVINDGVCLIHQSLYFKSGNKWVNSSPECGVLLESGVSANMFFPAGSFGTVGTPNAHYIEGFEIDGGYIDQNITDAGDFVESIMTVVLMATKKVKFRTEFRNPSGDCVYINRQYSSQASTVVPDNIDISFCTFRGTNINRNGVSVIHCNNFKINHNNFYNITKVGMPCPIDIEPNSTADTITNGQIIGNNFYECKSAISTYTTGTQAYDHVQNIQICNNNAYGGYFTGTYTTKACADFSVVNAKNVTFSNNNSTNAAGVAFWVEDSKNVTGSGNNAINPNEIGLYIKDVYDLKLSGKIQMANDQYEGINCKGIFAETAGLISANNHTLETGELDFDIESTATPVNNLGMYLKGNVTGVTLKGTISGFNYGQYLERSADVYPNKLTNLCKFSGNNTNIGNAIGASTSDQQSWDCGKDVSWGKSSFSASTTKDIAGLHVFPTSTVSVTRLGTTGLANTLAASCSVAGTLRITSNASESGEFVWRIISP